MKTMRPETLPESYVKLLRDVSPVEPKLMETLRQCTRGIPIDYKVYNDLASNLATNAKNSATINYISSSFPKYIDCSVLHPMSSTCFDQQKYLFWKVSKRMFPIYATITCK